MITRSGRPHFVNDSWFPNCQQVTMDGACRLVALRDIHAGEELSYSCVTLENAGVMGGSSGAGGGSAGPLATAERQSILAQNWDFTCTCPRCRHVVDTRAFDAAHVCYCGAVCVHVDRSTGVCVCHPSRVDT
jgi:SET domain-containing protein